MVEYEIIPKPVHDYPLNVIKQLKVNPKDNTITIKKEKDSWTKEERSLDLMNCVSELAAQFGHASTSSEMKKWNDATTNWIKEN